MSLIDIYVSISHDDEVTPWGIVLPCMDSRTFFTNNGIMRYNCKLLEFSHLFICLDRHKKQGDKEGGDVEKANRRYQGERVWRPRRFRRRYITTYDKKKILARVK